MTSRRKRHDEWRRTKNGMWICKLGRRGELQVKLFEKRSNGYYYADVFAPGIAAPVGSRTVPEIAAVAPCACKFPDANVMRTAVASSSEIAFIGSPPPESFVSNYGHAGKMGPGQFHEKQIRMVRLSNTDSLKVVNITNRIHIADISDS